MPGTSNSGRKVIPIDIKKAKGTYRKERDRHAPNPSPETARPPSWLNPDAKKVFTGLVDRLKDIRLGSATHTEAIALLAARMEEFERFDRLLNDKGYTYMSLNRVTGEISYHMRPEVKLRKAAAEQIHRLLSDFGLTPASAAKVGDAGRAKEKGDKQNEFSGF